ncbi:MAG: hypothetical protein EOO14_18010 [Chitinophagaceae bacterium]|nr:MAG: hypothetical protein EOO14_18010 [Chitinophagaceae bacterium]
MQRPKSFWIGLCLLNLCLIALFGLLMRSKILFPIPLLDYRNLLSAHSHFAFGGWAGLALLTLLVYDVLPAEKAQKKIYQTLLWGIEISSLGMAFTFPFWGYTALSITFSSLYIVVTYVFGWVFWKDMQGQALHPAIKMTSLGAIAALLLSAVGPAILSYILIVKSTNSLLYRDAVYTFLHFQYNGFFTLAIFATLFSYWLKKEGSLPPAAKKFSVFLLLSLVPSLCLALLWHNLTILYVLSGFLHLVFLGFVSFFILSNAIEEGFFNKNKKTITWPFYLFGLGVLVNEAFLMIQGLEILLKTNSPIYYWLLWIGAILLFLGSLALAFAFYTNRSAHEKTVARATASL